MRTTFDWKLIDELATALGVKPKALEQWHTRKSVPHRWRLPLIRASRGRLPLDFFEDGKAGRSQSREGIPA